MEKWTIQIEYRLEGVSSEEADAAVHALRAEGFTANHSVDSLVVSGEQIAPDEATLETAVITTLPGLSLTCNSMGEIGGRTRACSLSNGIAHGFRRGSTTPPPCGDGAHEGA